jgi:hypothetical protein
MAAGMARGANIRKQPSMMISLVVCGYGLRCSFLKQSA